MADAPVPYNPPRQDEIALCAYLIWQAEGCPGGRDLAHWLQAEAQLTATRLRDAGLMPGNIMLEVLRGQGALRG